MHLRAGQAMVSTERLYERFRETLFLYFFWLKFFCLSFFAFFASFLLLDFHSWVKVVVVRYCLAGVQLSAPKSDFVFEKSAISQLIKH